jgi:hypothetical protein
MDGGTMDGGTSSTSMFMVYINTLVYQLCIKVGGTREHWHFKRVSQVAESDSEVVVCTGMSQRMSQCAQVKTNLNREQDKNAGSAETWQMTRNQSNESKFFRLSLRIFTLPSITSKVPCNSSTSNFKLNFRLTSHLD